PYRRSVVRERPTEAGAVSPRCLPSQRLEVLGEIGACQLRTAIGIARRSGTRARSASARSVRACPSPSSTKATTIWIYRPFFAADAVRRNERLAIRFFAVVAD